MTDHCPTCGADLTLDLRQDRKDHIIACGKIEAGLVEEGLADGMG